MSARHQTLRPALCGQVPLLIPPSAPTSMSWEVARVTAISTMTQIQALLNDFLVITMLEYTFAFVVEKRGIFSYRWLSKLSMWPGINQYTVEPFLSAARPSQRPSKTTPPCLQSDDSCVLYHPSSLGDRGCVTAGGDPTFLQGMGVALAEGRNWWNWMNDTGQWWDYTSGILNKKISMN